MIRGESCTEMYSNPSVTNVVLENLEIDAVIPIEDMYCEMMWDVDVDVRFFAWAGAPLDSSFCTNQRAQQCKIGV